MRLHMLRSLTSRSERPEEPPTPPLRWYTALTVYRDPASPDSSVRAVDPFQARSAKEATLLHLAKLETGPPTPPGKDLSTWTMVRLDISETGEQVLDEQNRQRHAAR
ncbi:hypothetical protein ABT272_31175 [Streptomyces sp900105245]|uniref:Uncharacterized protein n=1 Tax=Streptomyces sp. 900105245 TaxID=3154379 RepID=A0ABV1UFU1_9ACTN